MIFLDGASTCPVLPDARRAVADAFDAAMGNPSSTHAAGRAAREVVEDARDALSAFVGAAPEDVVLTSGATEGLHAVLSAHRGPVLSAPWEHPATRGAAAPGRLALGPEGRLDLDVLEAALRDLPEGALLSLGVASGETGILQDVPAIAAVARGAGAALLLDLSQAVGRVAALPLDHADYAVLSGHKWGAPMGTGALLRRPGRPWPVLSLGGGQEWGARAGTENVHSLAGLGAAARVRRAGLSRDLERMAALRDRLERGCAAVAGAAVNGAGAPRVATTTSLRFDGLDAVALSVRLDAAGVMCSQVSACSSGRPEPSPVLRAMGLSDAEAASSLRFAVTPLTTGAEVDAAVEIVAREASELRRDAA